MTAFLLLSTARMGLAEDAKEEPTAELELIGRLDAIAATPACGQFHFGAVAVYGDLTLIRGDLKATTIQVVHGCPELPRKDFAEGSGNLERFRMGDYHHLYLTSQGVRELDSVVEPEKLPDGPRYYCQRVDAAPAPGQAR